MTVVLAIDAGTTSVRTIAFDASGRIVASAQREFPQYFPMPGRVEHDAAEIWDAVQSTLGEVAGGLEEPPAAIGVTNQRETAVAWSRRSSEPVHRAIVWQDRRTASRCAQLERDGALPMVRECTGLVLDPYFSASKLEWMLTAGGGGGRPRPRAGDGRQLDRLEPHRWRDPRHRRHQRGPHHALRHRLAAMACRPVLAVRRTHGGSAAGAALQRPVRRHRLERRVRPGRADHRCRRRSARGPLRPGRLRAGRRQEHLRHRLVRADERRGGAPTARGRPAHHRRLAAGHPAGTGPDVRAGGGDLRHRGGRPVASRRTRDRHRGRPDRGKSPSSATRPAGCSWCRHSRGSAARTGIPTPAAPSSASHEAPDGPRSPELPWRPWPTRHATSSRRWPPPPARRFEACASTGARR